MNTKLFGQYLLERGLISREQMLDVIEEQRQLNPRLEDLAVALGLLSLSDLYTIRSHQIRKDESFERIAVSLGLLTPTQIRELSDRREAKQVLLSQILLSRGHVDLDDLVLAEYEYGRESRKRSAQLEALLKNADCGEVVAVAASVLERMYERLTGDSLQLRDATAAGAIDLTGRLWTQQLTIDTDEHTLAFQMDERAAMRLGSAFLGVEMESYDDLTEDAVSEFLNVVIGHVCGNLDARPGTIHVDPPEVSSAPEFFKDYPGALILEGASGEVDFRFAIGSIRHPRPLYRLTDSDTESETVGASS